MTELKVLGEARSARGIDAHFQDVSQRSTAEPPSTSGPAAQAIAAVILGSVAGGAASPFERPSTGPRHVTRKRY